MMVIAMLFDASGPGAAEGRPGCLPHCNGDGKPTAIWVKGGYGSNAESTSLEPPIEA